MQRKVKEQKGLPNEPFLETIKRAYVITLLKHLVNPNCFASFFAVIAFTPLGTQNLYFAKIHLRLKSCL